MGLAVCIGTVGTTCLLSRMYAERICRGSERDPGIHHLFLYVKDNRPATCVVHTRLFVWVGTAKSMLSQPNTREGEFYMGDQTENNPLGFVEEDGPGHDCVRKGSCGSEGR